LLNNFSSKLLFFSADSDCVFTKKDIAIKNSVKYFIF